MVLSKSQLSPTEESMDTDLEDTNRQYKWLLSDLPSLPTFSHVKQKTCNALRQVGCIEQDRYCISTLIRQSFFLPKQSQKSRFVL